MPRRKLVIDDSDDPLAFMTKPEKSARTYDSTLSKPGHFCKNCRSFVGGGLMQCPSCFTDE
jgi:hypothetical protein